MPNAASVRPSDHLVRAHRQRLRLKCRKIETTGSRVDVEAYDVPVGVEIDIQPVSDLSRFRARTGFELDIQAIGFGIIVEFHGVSIRKPRSKKASWIV